MGKRPGLSKQTVIEAAAEMLDQRSTDVISLKELAEVLGVRTPSLYNHVDGMEGISEGLRLYARQKYLQTIKDALLLKTGEDAVYAYVLGYRTFARTHPGLYRYLHKAKKEGVSMPEEEKALETEIFDITLKVLAPIVLNEDEQIHLLRGLRSLLHGFVSLENEGGFGLSQSTEESFVWMIRVFLKGLTAAP